MLIMLPLQRSYKPRWQAVHSVSVIDTYPSEESCLESTWVHQPSSHPLLNPDTGSTLVYMAQIMTRNRHKGWRLLTATHDESSHDSSQIISIYKWATLAMYRSHQNLITLETIHPNIAKTFQQEKFTTNLISFLLQFVCFFWLYIRP